jgi:uncharacterized protein YjiS (DUF1127 family)
MTALAMKLMTNHHVDGLFSRLLQTLWAWQVRSAQRAELARWTDYELHDIGLSRSAIASEIEKPFWRA